MSHIQDFLPTTAKEVKAKGIAQLDVILFSGDAYIDHPAFGTAVIGRTLEAAGYSVAIVPQPNWKDDLRDFKKLGTPRLFFGVNAGAMDSMVNHYTANIRLRSNDAYTAGGKAGFRPDYAVSTYTKILKELYPSTPVIIGGIEASLRRLTHYDYWSNSLKPSILKESGADILSYGMGEGTILEITKALHNGYNAKLLRKIPQVAFLADKDYVQKLDTEKVINLNSFENCAKDKLKFCDNFTKIETLSNQMVTDKILVEPTGDKFTVVNPPQAPMTEKQIDASFDLPYTREPHPRYRNKGDIPAYDMIKNSVNIHRGCFGGCSFCTISAHQGKFIASRSERSILEEIKKITELPSFKGVLTDLGGPSANMYKLGGKNTELCKKCSRHSCLFPSVCKNLNRDHSPLLKLYRKVGSISGVKNFYIGSGIRYDLFDPNDNNAYLREVITKHTSGRLKVAPEHTEDHVLNMMRKPSFDLFEKLNRDFKKICAENSLRYQLIPYFISSHPGCREIDMKNLSKKTKSLNFNLEQVQDLTPTPMTLSSVMFYTGLDPYTKKAVYVARNQDEKRKQKSYFF